jgi:hypothetical protein
MARLLDRLADYRIPGLPQKLVTWSQRVCEKIEAQFTNILEALITIGEVAPITITADYAGVVTPSNQLPKTVLFKLYEGSTDVTADAAWSVDSEGDITGSIGAATGAYTFTDIGSDSVVTATGVYQAITRTRILPISFNTGQTPATGSGGGSSASTSTFADINSASHAAICTLTATAGAGGIITLSAPLSVLTSEAAPNGTFKVYGKWQWDSTGGGVWVDLAAEVSSSPDCRVIHDIPSGEYIESNGGLSVPDAKTGLVAASSHNFRLMARNNSGTRVMSFSGTASAVGS